jgi:hypothetical protein
MRYSDGIAFRQALEQRLKTRAGGHEARLVRDRKRVAFDRLLARLAATAPDRWLLKGGFALDLRLAERARTTKDIDIDWLPAQSELLDTLIEAAELDMSDFFSFSIERTGPPADRLGGSHRFRVLATLAARQFETFLLDVGFRPESTAQADTLRTGCSNRANRHRRCVWSLAWHFHPIEQHRRALPVVSIEVSPGRPRSRCWPVSWSRPARLSHPACPGSPWTPRRCSSWSVAARSLRR